jgi:hypothetical protein
MHRLGWVVLVLALVEGGWLAVDGAHALIVGDYVTPDSGAHAGELGPWSQVVATVGIEPRSTLMKTIHLGLGLAWCTMMIGFACQRRWAWRGMLTCALLALWYVPFGTLLSLVQVGLLLHPSLRRHPTS